MFEFLLNPYVLVTLAIIGLALLSAVLRYAGKKYAESYGDTQIAQAIFAAEKWSSEKVKEQYVTGAEKRDKAIEIIKNKIYPKLPIYVTLFITEAKLVDGIEFIYYSALDYLDDGELNKSL